MAADARDTSILEPLIDVWDVEAAAPAGEWSGTGRTTFEWLLGRTFVLERSEVDHPEAPDTHAILAPAAGGNGWTSTTSTPAEWCGATR